MVFFILVLLFIAESTCLIGAGLVLVCRAVALLRVHLGHADTHLTVYLVRHRDAWTGKLG